MAEPATEQPQHQAKKKGKGLLIVLIVALVIVAAGAGFGLTFLLGGGRQAQAGPEEAADQAPEPETSIMVPLDTFVVNLADPKGDRFLKATLRAVVTREDVARAMKQEGLLKARMRDRVISVLSSKLFQELNTPIGKEGLRRELTRELNQVLPGQSVREILLVEFIVQ
ncbi:MAG: flagellar basal body-associated FliL family protein [Acidobacteriota bacterium]|nr:MAG: flagellar basal body-associated FliL family protein [Acidobacteriota bacterium]